MFKNYENKSLKIKLNAPLRKHRKGTELEIKVDSDGVPIERYWRDRFKDAPIDNCLEIKETDDAN